MSYPDFSNAVLMQYETPLPDDFDMDGVRTRVREKAGAFDQLPGMFVKFYAINEVTVASSPVTFSKIMRTLLAGRLHDGH